MGFPAFVFRGRWKGYGDNLALIDLTGQRFGRLVVQERAANIGKQTAWLCKCDCGNEKIVTGSNLKLGHAQSCGCLWKEVVPEKNKEKNTRHGETHTKLHRTWVNMRYRCNNPNCWQYKDYGGRGISVCEDWELYEAFRDWAIASGYSDDLSIDRIDVDGNYEPSNCRWVGMKTQSNNTRRNHVLTYNNQTHTIQEWSEITGINWTTIKARIERNWPIEEALTKEVT